MVLCKYIPARFGRGGYNPLKRDRYMGFFETVWSYIRLMSIMDIIDIAIVAFAIYKIITYAKGTRVSQLLKGIVVLLVIMQVSSFLQLNAVNYILRNLMQIGLLALIVVFQPELRRMLESVGTRGWGLSFLSRGEEGENAETLAVIESVCKAAVKMSEARIGALIVFERKTYLQDIAKSGTRLDARVSEEFLQNIFYPKAPLHDGAAIISENLVAAAGCILPLSQQRGINKELGTRHRAALGASETSDAVVVVVSEESGMISFAQKGVLTRGLDAAALSDKLQSALIEPDEIVTRQKNFVDILTDFFKPKKDKEDKTRDE